MVSNSKRDGSIAKNIRSFLGRQLMKQTRELYNFIETQNSEGPVAKTIRLTLGPGDDFLRSLQANEFDKLLGTSLTALLKAAQLRLLPDNLTHKHSILSGSSNRPINIEVHGQQESAKINEV